MLPRNAQMIDHILQADAQGPGRQRIVVIVDVLSENLVEKLVEQEVGPGICFVYAGGDGLQVQPVLELVLLQQVQLLVAGPGLGGGLKGCLIGLELGLEILEHSLLATLENEAHVLEPGNLTQLCSLFQVGFNALEGAFHKFRKQLFQKPTAMLVVELFQ